VEIKVADTAVDTETGVDIKYCSICGWPIHESVAGDDECTGCRILKLRNSQYTVKDEDDGYPD